MKIVWIVTFIGLFISPPTIAEPLTSEDRNNIQKRTWSETFVVERYFPDNFDDVDVIGVQFDRFINDTIFVGGDAYGAVTGGRGGYALGAFHVGAQYFFTPKAYIQFRGLFGGAGGGGINAGGGLLLEPVVSLGYQLSRYVALSIGGGYLKFLTSSEGFPVGQISLTLSRKHLYIPGR